MDYGMLLAEKMRRYRKENGLYQWQLGEKLGVTQGAIGKYETERIMPPIDVIVRFAELLGVSIDELLSSSIPNSQDYVVAAVKMMRSGVSASS